MDISNIKEIWQQHEKNLEETRKLNVALLREVKLDKAKSKVESLLFLPVSTMVFFIFLVSYSLFFSVTNWKSWYYALSGIVVAFFSILFILASIRQLKLLLLIDYNIPIVQLQKQLSQIKLSLLTNLKIAAWVIPFYPFVSILVNKTFFDYDLMAGLTTSMLMIYAAITVLLIIMAVLITRAFRPENINKKWVNWLLQGNGSQLDEASVFLQQIQRFEETEANAN